MGAEIRIQDWAFGVGARELDLRFIFSQTSRLLLHCKTAFYSLNFPCYSMILYLWTCIFLYLEYLLTLLFLENIFLTLKMQFKIYFFCQSFPSPTNVELDVLLRFFNLVYLRSIFLWLWKHKIELLRTDGPEDFLILYLTLDLIIL